MAKALPDLNELDSGLQKEEEEADVGLGVVKELLDEEASGSIGVFEAVGLQYLLQRCVAVCGLEPGVATVLSAVLVAARGASGSTGLAGSAVGCVCGVHGTRVEGRKGLGEGGDVSGQAGHALHPQLGAVGRWRGVGPLEEEWARCGGWRWFPYGRRWVGLPTPPSESSSWGLWPPDPRWECLSAAPLVSRPALEGRRFPLTLAFSLQGKVDPGRVF